jgi:hypothetical protein
MLKKITWLLAAALFGTVLAQDASAVVLTTGQSVTFNYDLTGQVPPPPYSDVYTWTMNNNIGVAGDEFQVQLFPQLNGAGVAASVLYDCAFICTGIGFDTVNAGVISDGIFSAVVTDVSGTLNISQYVYGISATGSQTPNVNGSVPEPATLSLLGLGLAGIGVMKRRKMN